MNQPIDLTGRTFGRWTVGERAESSKSGKGRFNVRCDCGAEKQIQSTTLISGKSNSCGCLKSERIIDRNLKHGKSGTTEYSTWHAMLSRCYDKNKISYVYYGARGIDVCQRWRDSFEAFLSDMGERPSTGLTLDRVDNDKGYSPENCAWRTWSEQNANKRAPKFTNKQISASNKSGHIGVRRIEKSGNWTATIKIGDKSKHLGTFHSRQLAIDVRRAHEYLYDYFRGRTT